MHGTFFKALRWFGSGAAIMVGVAALVAAGALMYVRTDEGRAWAVRLAARLASDPGGITVTVERSSGDLLGDFTLSGVVGSDRQGRVFAVETARVVWRPSALLRRKLDVLRLDIGGVHLDRLPARARAGPPPAAPKGNFVERIRGSTRNVGLPVDLSVGRLEMTRVMLAREIYGSAVTLSIDGHIRAARTLLPVNVDLRGRRTDGVAAEARLRAKIDRDSNALQLNFSIREAAGGAVARLLDVPKRPPVSFALTGKGTLDGWTGAISGEIGDKPVLTGRLSLALRDGLRFSTDGTLVAAAVPSAARLFGSRTTFAIAGLVRPGGTVGVSSLEVAAATMTVTAKGDLSFVSDSVSATIETRFPDIGRFGALAGTKLAGAGTARATLSGRLSLPAVVAKINLTEPVVSGISARSLDIDLTVTPQAARALLPDRVAVVLKSRAAGIRYPGGALAAGGKTATTIELGGILEPRRERLALDRVLLATPFGQVSGRAELIGFGAPRIKAKLAARDVTVPWAPAGLSRRLRLAADLSLDLADQTGYARLTGEGHDPDLGVPSLRPLLAGPFSVDADLRLDKGIAILRAARMTMGRIEARASGRFRLDGGNFDMTAQFGLSSLSVLSRLAGVPLAGAVDGRVSLRGTVSDLSAVAAVDSKGVRVGRTDLGSVSLRATLGKLLTAPAGPVDVSVVGPGLNGTLSTRVAVQGRRLRLAGLKAAAAGARVRADLMVDLTSATVAGKAEATMADLAPLARLAGLRLAGSARLTARKPDSGSERIRIDLVASDLVLEAPASSRLAVSVLSATVTSSSLGRNAAVDVKVTAEKLRRGTVRLERMAATLKGRAARAEYTASVKGTSSTVPIAFDSRGLATDLLGKAMLRIDTIDGNLASHKLRLAAPARIAFVPGLRVDPTDLRIGKGAMRLRYAERGRTLDLLVSLDSVPADLLRLSGLTGQVDGDLSGRLALRGDRNRPQGDFTLNGSGLRLSRDALAPLLALGAKGRILADRANLTAHVTAERGKPLRLTADLPLSAKPGAPIKVAVAGPIELDVLSRFGLFGDNGVRGTLQADFVIAGTVRRPVIKGAGRLKGGKAELPRTGTVLSNLALDIDSDGAAVRIRGRSTTGRAKGPIDITGVVRLDRGDRFPFDLSMKLDEAHLLRLDDATATLTGRLTVRGDAVKGAEVAGTMTVNKAEIRIPDRGGTKIYELEVVEINRPGTRALRRPGKASAKPAGPAMPFAVGLNVDLDIPGRTFVRGQGIETEWRGKLRIRGRLPMPKVEGALTTVRGRADVVGKRFEITKGRIGFGGGNALDPTINVVAERKAAGITAQVMVGGTARRPKIDIRSEPALPTEEVLSRVLFGKESGALTSGQAIQLGLVAASFAAPGKAPDLPNLLRRTVGLDLLEISGDGDKAEDSRLKIGKYVTDRVLLKAEQGLKPKDNKAGVEVEVLKNIIIESDVAGDSEGKVGIKWRFDY